MKRWINSEIQKWSIKRWDFECTEDFNIIKEHQICKKTSIPCHGKCIEGVDGGLSCDGTYSCHVATIRPSSDNDNVICTGHDLCTQAYIFGNAICNGHRSCRSALIC